MLKRLSLHPFWGQVLAAVVASAGIGGGVYLFGLGPAIWQWLKDAGEFLLGTTPVWNWLIGLAVALIGLLALMLAARFLKALAPTQHEGYRQDTFHGVVWRWSYESDGEITRLACFCP